jgi:hypothetical protein
MPQFRGKPTVPAVRVVVGREKVRLCWGRPCGLSAVLRPLWKDGRAGGARGRRWEVRGKVADSGDEAGCGAAVFLSLTTNGCGVSDPDAASDTASSECVVAVCVCSCFRSAQKRICT